MAVHRMPVDPDAGIPDLLRRIGDDSKRLVNDELRLAKLEAKEHVKRAGHGAMWLAIAFGVGVVALVAATLLIATLLGRWLSGHMWFGAIITGAIELIVGALLIKRGIAAFGKPSYSLEQTRESLTETQGWVKAIP